MENTDGGLWEGKSLLHSQVLSFYHPVSRYSLSHIFILLHPTASLPPPESLLVTAPTALIDLSSLKKLSLEVHLPLLLFPLPGQSLPILLVANENFTEL